MRCHHIEEFNAIGALKSTSGMAPSNWESPISLSKREWRTVQESILSPNQFVDAPGNLTVGATSRRSSLHQECCTTAPGPSLFRRQLGYRRNSRLSHFADASRGFDEKPYSIFLNRKCKDKMSIAAEGASSSNSMTQLLAAPAG
jgi:hypothetical protein